MEHNFNVDVAVKYGVNAAVLLNNIAFWIAKNEANGENFFDGRYWTYNSVKAMSKLFPYLTGKQIRTALNILREENIIVIGNYNEQKYDRTLWYSITEKGIMFLHVGRVDSPCGASQNDQQGEPIPDINTDINHIVNTYKREAAEAAPPTPKKKYGSYNNVKLTDDELSKLQAEFHDCEQRIERLSEYLASKGDKYKSHYATIRSWAHKDGIGSKQITPEPETAEGVCPWKI